MTPSVFEDGGVAEFVATWGLNDSSAELLRSLDDHTRQKVMTEFSPRDGTHNIEGKFNAFVRSLNASAGAGLQDRPSAEDLAEIAPELGEFCATWGLDTAGVAWLHSLPVEVVKVVIAQFEPKEDTQNIIGKLKAFARSVQARQPSMNAALASAPWNNGYGGNMRADTIGPPGADLVTFAEQWSLDEATVQQLRAYPPDVQATVVKNFHPKGEIHNINGKCLAFARSIGMGSQHQQKHYSSTPVDAFANWWQLDDSTRAFMWSLSEDVRRTVIEQFDPAPGTRDIAGRLKQFARSLSMQGHGSYGGGHSSQFVPWNAPIGGKGAKGGPSWSAPSAPASGASAASLSAADQEFLASWGMLNDSRAVGALQQLSPSLKMRALTEFLPGADTRDIGSRFCAFLTSLSRSTQEYGASGPGALGSLALSSFGSTGAPSANHIALGSGVTPSPAVEEFATRWGLEHSCKIRLAELPGEVQELVMTEFNPKGDTIDINGKFVSFMRSVAQRAEVGKRSLGSPVGAPPWQPPNKRPHLDLGGW
mmetsp:Transcript_55502/g.124813  ORF Transcript_55502/g.124813 Transcript_55502/m.124813 type:complete len:535 (+) Transcript_55502:84-1688(+)